MQRLGFRPRRSGKHMSPEAQRDIYPRCQGVSLRHFPRWWADTAEALAHASALAASADTSADAGRSFSPQAQFLVHPAGR